MTRRRGKSRLGCCPGGSKGLEHLDYGEAVRNLARDARFSPDLVRKLERLPGFRNVVIHEYVALDLERVVEEFLDVARRLVADLPDL